MNRTKSQYIGKAVGLAVGLLLVSQASAAVITPDIEVGWISWKINEHDTGYTGKAIAGVVTPGPGLGQKDILEPSTHSEYSVSNPNVTGSFALSMGGISGSFSIYGDAWTVTIPSSIPPSPVYTLFTGGKEVVVDGVTKHLLLSGTLVSYTLNYDTVTKNIEGANVFFTPTGGAFASDYGSLGMIQYHVSGKMADVTPVPEPTTCLAGFAAGVLMLANVYRSKKSK